MIDLYILISLEAVPHCQMIWNDYLKYHVANVTHVCKSRKEAEPTGPSSVGPASSLSKKTSFRHDGKGREGICLPSPKHIVWDMLPLPQPVSAGAYFLLTGSFSLPTCRQSTRS